MCDGFMRPLMPSMSYLIVSTDERAHPRSLSTYWAVSPYTTAKVSPG